MWAGNTRPAAGGAAGAGAVEPVADTADENQVAAPDVSAAAMALVKAKWESTAHSRADIAALTHYTIESEDIEEGDAAAASWSHAGGERTSPTPTPASTVLAPGPPAGSAATATPGRAASATAGTPGSRSGVPVVTVGHGDSPGRPHQQRCACC